MYLNAGELDLSSLHDDANKKLLLQHCAYVWENLIRLAPVHTAVFNLNSLSWGCVQPATLQLFSHMLQVYDSYYPDVSKQILLINAPAIMPFIWPMIQCLIHSSLKNRIHFLSGPDALKEYIDESQLGHSILG
jgi:hypothetical protein